MSELLLGFSGVVGGCRCSFTIFTSKRGEPPMPPFERLPFERLPLNRLPTHGPPTGQR